MKIALYHNLPSGGAKRVAYEHCRALVAAGHDVIVYEPQTADASFLDLAPIATALHRLPLVWRPSPLHTVGNHRRLTALQQRLARQVDEGAFDLAYVHQDAFESAPSLLRFLKTPSVYFCQEPLRRVFEAPLLGDEVDAQAVIRSGCRLWLKAAMGSPLVDAHVRYRLLNERANTAAATLVLANSTYSCESILRAHGRVARRLPLGVDADSFRPDGAPREPFVFSVGGFSPRKGFRFLIRSLALVPPAARPPLVLAGDRVIGGEVNVLRELARELAVELTLWERPDEAGLRDLYRRARLFVYAPYLEPLGLVALEAMACGTPVLGVGEGGVRETVVEGVNGRLAEHNETLFAQALAQMLADSAGLEAMGRAAREHVAENWTWEKSVAHLLTHFAEARQQAGG